MDQDDKVQVSGARKSEAPIDNQAIKVRQLELELQRLSKANSNLSNEKDKIVLDYEEKLGMKASEMKRMEKQLKEHDGVIKALQVLMDKKKESLEEVQDDTQKQLISQIDVVMSKRVDVDDLTPYDPGMDSQTRTIVDLKKRVQQLKTDKNQEVNKVEIEKITATENLRKEMLQKIKETKANLLAMSDEQLSTTTRLTILQNQQLTTELEYQSKQSESLLFKNGQMKEKIESLTRDIHIHQDVEKELAKRSHYSQKIIKRMKDRIQDLEERLQQKNATPKLTLDNLQPINYHEIGAAKYGITPQPGRYKGSRKNGQSMSVLGSVRSNSRRSPLKHPSIGNSYQNNDSLIQYLENKMELQEQSLSKCLKDYNELQQEYRELQDKFMKSSDKYKTAALIMTDYLDDLLASKPNLLASNHDIHLNIEKVRENKIEDLDKEDKVALVLVLLKQLQPFLSVGTMSTQATSPTPSKRHKTMSPSLLTPDNFDQVSKFSNLVRQQNIDMHKKSFQQKSSGKHDAIVSEVDALNNILSNINVHNEGPPIGNSFHGKYNSTQLGHRNSNIHSTKVILPPI